MDRSGVLEQLWTDHRVSAHLLRVLEHDLPAAAGGEREALAVLRDVVRREREYCDVVHHAREELLFSRLASRAASGVQAVAGLTHDHDELARRGETLLESLDAALAGRDGDPDAIRRRVREYAEGLRNHMHKEERRVFALAEDLLTDEDWQLVAGAFSGRGDPLARPAGDDYRALRQRLASRGESPL